VQVHLFGQAESMTADLDEVAGGDERLEVTSEGRPLVAGHLQYLNELARAGRMVHALANERENSIW